MRCNDAMEFVSALCDGETIPRDAAAHIGTCNACQSVLTEYLEIGTELRRVASLAPDDALRPLKLKKKHGTLRAIWQTGLQTMRIPRFAFATLLVGIVALSLSLALVKVRAHSEGSVLMLTVAPKHGQPLRCPLSTVDKKNSQCEWTEGTGSGELNFAVRLISKEGDRVRLGVRTEYDPGKNTSFAVRKDSPEKQYLFEPGETLQIDVRGFTPLTATGEWMAYMPYFSDLNLEENLEPGPDELRLVSPVLLKGKQVVVDFSGMSLSADEKGDLAWLYVPGDGLYEFSLSPLAGAVEGHAENNRLSFRDGGQSYLLLTGTPIARSGQIWIVHTAHVKLADPDFSDGNWAGGTEEINHSIPRTPAKN